jgi:hypothetical protein
MALTITYTTLSTTYDSDEHDTNWSDVQSKFGNIVDADIKSDAAIGIDKLAASYQEVFVQLKFSGVLFGAWPAAPVDPAAPTFAELIDYIPLPGTDADTPWIATDVSWCSNDTGTASGSFDVRFGAYSAVGVMTGAGTVITGAAITFIGADLGNEGRALEGGSVSLTQAPGVRGLYLVSAGAGTAVMDDVAAPGSWLQVTVALRRQIQA